MQAADTSWVGKALDSPPLAPGDRFGATLAIGDGLIAVGAYLADTSNGVDSGAVYFYLYDEGEKSWELHLEMTEKGDAGDQLGFDLAIDSDGTTLLAGAPFARNLGGVRCGAVRKITLVGSRIVAKVNLGPPVCEEGAEFGSAVAVEGGIEAVGARGTDRRRGRIYRFDGRAFGPLEADALEGDELGTSLTTDGLWLVAGAPFADAPGAADSGAAFVFASGQFKRRVLPRNPQARAAFGYSVDVRGANLAVGAPLEDGHGSDSGAVHFFRKADWDDLDLPVAQGEKARDQFGVSVTSGKSDLFAGARRAGGHGEVYLVDGERKTPIRLATPPPAGAEFGFGVATREAVLAVGAFLEKGSGAAYVFEQPQVVTLKLSAATCVIESEGVVPLSVTVTTGDERPTRSTVAVGFQTCPLGVVCTAQPGIDFAPLETTRTIPPKTASGTSLVLENLTIKSDSILEDPKSVVVRMSVDGQPPTDLSITIHDSPLVLAADPVSTSESGGSTRFDVRLACQPAKVVRVSLRSSDSSEASVPPTVLRFTPASWNRTQSLEVTGVDDALCDGPQPYLLEVSTKSADPRFGGLLLIVPAENEDDELACLSAVNSVCAYVDNTVVYTIEISNEGPATVTSHLEDRLPSALSVVTASADSGVATVDYVENSVVWNGSAPAPGDEVTITVVAALDPVPAGTEVANQATLTWPRDSRGSPATISSDDPATPQPADATVFEALDVGCPP
jgi:uncharacterized repeat protein (TIGR01451 family)